MFSTSSRHASFSRHLTACCSVLLGLDAPAAPCPSAASCTSATALPSPLCASWAWDSASRRGTALSSARSIPVSCCWSLQVLPWLQVLLWLLSAAMGGHVVMRMGRVPQRSRAGNGALACTALRLLEARLCSHRAPGWPGEVARRAVQARCSCRVPGVAAMRRPPPACAGEQGVEQPSVSPFLFHSADRCNHPLAAVFAAGWLCRRAGRTTDLDVERAPVPHRHRCRAGPDRRLHRNRWGYRLAQRALRRGLPTFLCCTITWLPGRGKRHEAHACPSAAALRASLALPAPSPA